MAKNPHDDDRWKSLDKELGLLPESMATPAPAVADDSREPKVAPGLAPVVAPSEVALLPKSTKDYESLFRRHSSQLGGEIFASYRPEQTWDRPYERLAGMAKPEEWQFVRPEFRRPGVNFPILKQYLNNTFLRLKEQDKVRYSINRGKACFNTGLQTPAEKDIFAVFRRNPPPSVAHSGEPTHFVDWAFVGFLDSYAEELSEFRPLPELATYIEDSSDLVLDISYGLDINIPHIVDDPENHDRLPQKLRGERTLALAAIEGATKFLTQKVMRNYKTAIPFWYIKQRKIQLLLPLCIMNPETADLALVADKDRLGKLYRIRTALSMDMAYINARLLTRPDRDWLNP